MASSDAERLDRWVRDHGPAVRGYLLAWVRRRDVADELVQEVFSRAWLGRRRYREEGHARAYLLRIADRLVCDRARNRRPELQLDGEFRGSMEPAAADGDPAAAAIAAENERMLHEALDRLSPAQRRVLLLRYYGQLGFREIAETLDCPLGTALSHCRRGLGALRKMLVEKAS